MKCPTCGYDQKAKFGLRCSGCGYEFSFDPKSHRTQGLTDGKFIAVLKAASRDDTVFFTENQLYSAFCRRHAKVGKGGFVIAMLLIGAAIAMWFFWAEAREFVFIVGLIGAFVLLAAIMTAFQTRSRSRRSYFNDLVRRWREDGKPFGKLIEAPGLHKPPPEWAEPDIFDYGVERILIVERDLLVDMFVKNGVHAEQRMLVLSETGYPEYLVPVAQKLLAERPELPVFLLHDATDEGVEMQSRVRNRRLLPIDGHPLCDLGMFPENFKQLRRFAVVDHDNKERELPVDVMSLSFLGMGMTGAMAGGTSLATLLAPVPSDATYSFGTDFG